MADPFIAIQEVRKVYQARLGRVPALDGVSLEIAQGEFVSIVGPSGCGKSTLLLLVAGLIRPSAGRIAIGGRRVERPYPELGIVFQQDVLLAWRTVLDNVLLPAEIRRLPRARYEGRARELLDRTGLRGFEGAYPAELSGGMRQRVSLCRALLQDPPLLLMDEPFGALDALTREQMNLDLAHLCGDARYTVLFITHSIEEAVFLSDRVAVMSPRPGRILDVLPIGLPRPGHHGVKETASFHAHLAEVRMFFRSAGVLTG